MTDELTDALRSWLGKAFNLLMRVDALRKAPDEWDPRDSPPIRERDATSLIGQIGHSEHWQEVLKQMIQSGAKKWVDDGWHAWSPQDPLHLLELGWAVNGLRLYAITGTKANGAFDWSRLDDPLWDLTIRRLDQAGFEYLADATFLATDAEQAEVKSKGDQISVGEKLLEGPFKEKNIEVLAVETPDLNVESIDWIAARQENQEKLGYATATLRSYRLDSAGGRKLSPYFGVDKDGRRWRRDPGKTEGSTVYYYVPDLKKCQTKVSN